jgi:hypothetical protein
MRSFSLNGRSLRWALAGGACLGFAASRLQAQDVRRPPALPPRSNCPASPLDREPPPPGVQPAMPGWPIAPPQAPGEVAPPAPGDATAPPAPAPQAMPSMADSLTEPMAAFDPGQSLAGLGRSFAAANAIGDFIGAPFSFDLVETGGDETFGTGDDVEVDVTSPFGTRTFKIFEGQNARPQDRVFFSFNRFSDVGDVNDNNLYRYLVGFEKTFLDGRGSFGVQLPYYTVDPAELTLVSAIGTERAEIGQFGLSPETQSDVGDLTFILKYAVSYDPWSLDTCSVGVAYTAPTGPDTIAGIDTPVDVEYENRGSLQPFVGFLNSLDENWFTYGFTAVDIPIDSDDTTFWFNDLGIGYYLGNSWSDSITAIVPKLEVHVISPIENRNQSFTIRDDRVGQMMTNFSTRQDDDDDTGTLEIHNQVNITAGLTLEVRRNVTFTFAYVAPVAGPNPFDHEIQFQVQVFGGDSRAPLGFGVY